MQKETAYRRCLDLTKKEAKNFYFGIRLLPPPKRAALSAVYALARQADDIADEENPPDTKLELLKELRQKAEALVGGSTQDFGEEASLWGTYYASQDYPIPLAAFQELIDGCERDIKGTEYATFAETEKQCRLVAGSIGRLSLGIFGTDEPEPAAKIADDLGVALQLTNILRDLLEDKKMGRIYLPAEDFGRFGLDPELILFPLSSTSSLSPKDAEAFEAFIHFQAERVLSWYGKGFQLFNYLDRRSFSCTASMAGIYFGLLKKIQKDPKSVLAGRVSLSLPQKAIIVGRSLAGIRPAKI